MNFVNCGWALVTSVLYFRNAARCKTPHWRTYKFMLASCMLIISIIYALFILQVKVYPLVVRLNTTFFIGLMFANAILGRSKYGKRY